MKKIYVYFGSRNGSYNIAKSNKFNTFEEAINEVKTYLKNENLEEEGKHFVETLQKNTTNNGFYWGHFESGNSPTIIGVALHGRCKEIKSVFNYFKECLKLN